MCFALQNTSCLTSPCGCLAACGRRKHSCSSNSDHMHLYLQKEVPLGNPDVLVCSVGTEIFFEATGASPEANQEWKTELDQGWSRQEAIDAAAKFSELKAQVLQIYTSPVTGIL